MGIHQLTPPLDAASPSDSNIRKRVCKACDRCRLKKSKCDGSNPCSRCKADNAICVFGERKKSHDKVYPKGYVEMLENQQAQLVTGLQELYRRSQSGQGWTGPALKEGSNGAPLTHDILDRLGALKQENCNSPEEFEEDLTAMQQRLIASGAGFVHRDNMSDTSSEVDQSPYFEQFSAKSPLFSETFSFTQFPPTPPNQSPYPRTARTVPAPSRHQSSRQTSVITAPTWTPSNNNGFDDNMNFINKFDPNADYSGLPPQMFQNAMAMHAMNPTLAMKDWADEEDFQRFFNPTLL